MLKSNNFLILIYIIIYVFLNILDFNNIGFAASLEKSTTVYYCKLTDGTIGYYDRPCKYIVNSKFNNTNKLELITEKVLILKTNHKFLANYKIYDPYQDPSNKLPNKRCQNALTKIPLIIELLEKHQTLSISSKNQNNQEIIRKLKRSLARYNKIKQQSCENPDPLHEKNYIIHKVD